MTPRAKTFPAPNLWGIFPKRLQIGNMESNGHEAFKNFIYVLLGCLTKN